MTTEIDTTSPRRIRECCGGGLAGSTAAPGVVENCKLIGRRSSNGLEYTQEALEAAVPLYEGQVVFVDHCEDDPAAIKRKPRPFLARFGRVTNVRPDPQGDGLRYDLRYNPKHQLAATFEGWLETDPQSVGFSHDALSRVREGKDGSRVVTEIVKVYSVDLVAVPATTKGIREAHMDDMLDLPAATDAPAADPAPAAESFEDHLINACTAVLKDEGLDTKAKLAKIKDILKVMDGGDGGGEAPKVEEVKEDGEGGEDKEEAKEAAAPQWALDLTSAILSLGESLKATREAAVAGAKAPAKDNKPVSASPTKTDKPALSVDGLLAAFNAGGSK